MIKIKNDKLLFTARNEYNAFKIRIFADTLKIQIYRVTTKKLMK